MTTPTNGSQLTSDADLPVIRTSVPAPAEPGAPDSSTPDPAPAPVATSTAAVYPEPRNRAEETQRQRAERQGREMQITAASRLMQRVRHPDGGDSTVEEIQRQEKAQRDDIDRETAEGSRKHHRFVRWIRSIPKYVLAFDFGLLLYFFTGITNVNWASPVSLALAFAVVLAAMVTVLSYGFLTFTGQRLRSHKNNAGTIHCEDLDGPTIAVSVISVAVIAVLATLMFLRIRTEVLYALGTQAQVTALVIAVSVAVVNAAANFLVIAIHALDGSDQTTRLDRLSDAIRRPRRSPPAPRTGGQACQPVRDTCQSAPKGRDRAVPALGVEPDDGRSAVLLVGARSDHRGRSVGSGHGVLGRGIAEDLRQVLNLTEQACQESFTAWCSARLSAQTLRLPICARAWVNGLAGNSSAGYPQAAAAWTAVRPNRRTAWPPRPNARPLLAATLSAHGPAAFDVHVLAGLGGVAWCGGGGSGLAGSSLLKRLARASMVSRSSASILVCWSAACRARKLAARRSRRAAACCSCSAAWCPAGSRPPPAQCLGAGQGPAGGLAGQSRVSSATAFLAQASSTRSCPAAAAAMSAAVAALLRARGRPLETRCSRAMASSAKRGSSRPARARWWRR